MSGNGGTGSQEHMVVDDGADSQEVEGGTGGTNSQAMVVDGGSGGHGAQSRTTKGRSAFRQGQPCPELRNLIGVCV
eukprot:11232215-Alexandrium_andersonii.AAC.1